MCIIDPTSIVLCASVSCGVLTTTYLCRNLKKIPHPSECGYIGRIYRISGIHSHEPLDLIVDLQEGFDQLDNGQYYVEIESGRFTYRSQSVHTRKGKIQIYEKINVHVRQCDDFITVNLYKKHLVTSTLWGTVKISVNEEILSTKPPKKRTYTLVKNNESSTKLKLSIYKMDANIASMNLTPLTLQVLIQAQQEGNILEEDMLNTLDEMDDAERLRYFSKVITGPLKKMNAFKKGYTEYFFKPFEISPGYWLWCYWDSFDKYNAGEKQAGSIGFLSISLIIPDHSDRKRFYLRYHNQEGVYALLFKTTDRDRDIWIDGLNEFIQKATEVFNRNPEFKTIKKSVKGKGVTVTKAMDKSPKYNDLLSPNSNMVDGFGDHNDNEFYEVIDGKQRINPKFKENYYTLRSPLNAVVSERDKFRKNLAIMEQNMYRSDSDPDL